MKNLLITGNFRSGTTLLSTALNVHEKVVTGWQPYWLFFRECRNLFFKNNLRDSFDENFPMGVIDFKNQREIELFNSLFSEVNFKKKSWHYLLRR